MVFAVLFFKQRLEPFSRLQGTLCTGRYQSPIHWGSPDTGLWLEYLPPAKPVVQCTQRGVGLSGNLNPPNAVNVAKTDIFQRSVRSVPPLDLLQLYVISFCQEPVYVVTKFCVLVHPLIGVYFVMKTGHVVHTSEGFQ